MSIVRDGLAGPEQGPQSAREGAWALSETHPLDRPYSEYAVGSCVWKSQLSLSREMHGR